MIRQTGKDITIVAWAPATAEVKRALPQLAKIGISSEFIDPRTLKPLDVELLATSARKTRRLLVVEHGHYTNGLVRTYSPKWRNWCQAYGREISFPDVPGPAAGSMMNWLRPDAPKIVDAAIQLMKM